MTLWDILLIGAALSMDAVAVAAVTGMSLPRLRPGDVLLLGLAFGGFQGLMPLLGYYAGAAFAPFMQAWADLLAFGLLVWVGGKMLIDSLEGQTEALAAIHLRLVLLQALATSIDALAVGISLAALGSVSICQAALIIAGCTFTLSALAAVFGRLTGAVLADKAGIAGGLVLIGIGIKLLF